MADNKVYDRLPEETLPELRRKYLRKKPLYGKPLSRKAFLEAAYPSQRGKISYPRFADLVMLLTVLMLSFFMIVAPFSDGYSTLSAFDFAFGNSFGIVSAIDMLSDVYSFGEYLAVISMIAFCILVIVTSVNVISTAFKALGQFFTRNSGELRTNLIHTLMNIFATYFWCGLIGQTNELSSGSYSFCISYQMLTALKIAGGALLLCAIMSYGKGFASSVKKPCWWSSMLLIAVYSVIAINMLNLNISGLITSAAAGIGAIDAGYFASNTDFEGILIAAFNIFLIIALCKLKTHVRFTLSMELQCALGHAKGYVKTAPYASTRVKAAILPAIGIFAATVLSSEETGIFWPVYGLVPFLIKVVICLIIAAIVCKIMRPKTYATIR